MTLTLCPGYMSLMLFLHDLLDLELQIKTCPSGLWVFFCLPQRTPVNNGEAFRWFF